MPMNTPTILLYNLDNPRGAKIRRMCLSLRLRTALVPRESYGLPLGELAEGAVPEAPYDGDGFDDEMLLIVNCPGPLLDLFLQAFRPRPAEGGAHPHQPGVGLRGPPCRAVPGAAGHRGGPGRPSEGTGRGMKLLISPAKKMREDGDFLAPRQAPALLERAAVLAEWLRGLDYTALKKLLACNDSIAELNFRRFQEMDLRRPGTPALLSYDGIQYQYMAPHLFTRPQFEYAETHLRILSGFYGVLRPFDGVLPYRLEMGARCSTPFCKNLYDFWGDSLYRTLTAGGEDTLLNLASAEYAKAVRPWVTPPVRWIDVTFGEADGDKVVEKGGYVKMARGEMVRFLAERNAETPEAAQGFDRLGYRFSPAHSTAASYVFLREGRAN